MLLTVAETVGFESAAGRSSDATVSAFATSGLDFGDLVGLEVDEGVEGTTAVVPSLSANRRFFLGLGDSADGASASFFLDFLGAVDELAPPASVVSFSAFLVRARSFAESRLAFLKAFAAS